MSGVGELAYMILLGWMRALVNWFWRIISGGSGEGLQWFLSNWKLWLIIILAGGMIIDWMTWLIRWRPYRVFLSRFSRGANKTPAPLEESWDSGVGYYKPETMLDAEPADWSDTTLSTLSEIDPDWAGGVFVDEDESLIPQTTTSFYGESYEEPSVVFKDAEDTTGYWEDDPVDESDEAPWQALPYDEDNEQWEEPVPAEIYDEEEENEDEIAVHSQEIKYYDEDDEDHQANQWAELDHYQQPDQPLEEETQYGRTQMWPAMYPHIEKLEAEPPAPDVNSPRNYYADDAFASEMDDPLYSNAGSEAPPPHRESRLLRRLRKSDDEISRRKRSRQSINENQEAPVFDKTRPERLVQAVSSLPDQETTNSFRTVTGKPVKRQGLLRLSATDDDPISGLPPMQVGNAFYPKAMPNNPDFSDDDGHYQRD